MSNSISLGPVHHLALTVSDMDRSVEFYTKVLGFKVVVELPMRRLMHNGNLLLGVGPAQVEGQGKAGDTFDENRIGLDHVSFSVASLEDLQEAESVLDAHGVPHGELKDLGPGFGLYILPFRDPDNIQLELSAPYKK